MLSEIFIGVPVISPVPVQLRDGVPRLLPAPDYEVHALQPEAVALASAATTGAERATTALDEMERAAQISEYHDFSWWDERLRIVRDELRRAGLSSD